MIFFMTESDKYLEGAPRERKYNLGLFLLK